MHIYLTPDFTRDVILMDSSDDLAVPRGEKKCLLHRQRQIANMVDFQCGWTAQKVEEVLREDLTSCRVKARVCIDTKCHLIKLFVR